MGVFLDTYRADNNSGKYTKLSCCLESMFEKVMVVLEQETGGLSLHCQNTS